MKTKRVLAKLMDVMIFVFLSGIFCGLLILLVDTLLTNYDIMASISTFMTELSTLNAEAGLQYLQDNRDFFFLFMNLTFISLFIFGFIYFGVIGYFVRGSLGKYVLRIGVKPINGDKKVNMLILTLREPFLHMQLISYIFLVIAYFFPGLPLINIFQLLYIVLFFAGKDFWNQIFKVKVDTL